MIFEFLRQKWCRIIYKFRQNTTFGPETCEIRLKIVILTCPDLPRPVQEDNYLLQTSGNTFILSDFTPFPFLLLANLSCFLKIICFTKRIYHFYKIIGFIKRIYKFTSPYRQTTFLFLKFQVLRLLHFIINFIIFICINVF